MEGREMAKSFPRGERAKRRGVEVWEVVLRVGQKVGRGVERERGERRKEEEEGFTEGKYEEETGWPTREDQFPFDALDEQERDEDEKAQSSPRNNPPSLD